LNALDYWALTPKKYEAQEAQQLSLLPASAATAPMKRSMCARRKPDPAVPQWCAGKQAVTARNTSGPSWKTSPNEKKMEKEILERREENGILQKRHIAHRLPPPFAHELNQPFAGHRHI